MATDKPNRSRTGCEAEGDVFERDRKSSVVGRGMGTETKMRVHFSSQTIYWETPKEFFEKLNTEFCFTLDVCATKQNAKCAKFFSEEDNGLSREWVGTCWMNPPYGREIGKWVKKAHDANTTVVCLLPARTDTKWFHDYILGKAEIRFIKGRLKFGGSKSSAPFPSMLAIFKRLK